MSTQSHRSVHQVNENIVCVDYSPVYSSDSVANNEIVCNAFQIGWRQDWLYWWCCAQSWWLLFYSSVSSSAQGVTASRFTRLATYYCVGAVETFEKKLIETSVRLYTFQESGGLPDSWKVNHTWKWRIRRLSDYIFSQLSHLLTCPLRYSAWQFCGINPFVPLWLWYACGPFMGRLSP